MRRFCSARRMGEEHKGKMLCALWRKCSSLFPLSDDVFMVMSFGAWSPQVPMRLSTKITTSPFGRSTEDGTRKQL